MLQFHQETREVHAFQHTIEDKRLEQLYQTMERIALQLDKLEGQLRVDKYKPPKASANSTQKTSKPLQGPMDKASLPVLPMWARRTLTERLAIIRQCASPKGARQLA